ncbi:MAG: efflux RND transporter permease subunit [Alphaproteobacteria bacterium]
MKALIRLSLQYRRLVLLLFGFLILAGTITYFSIPREADPDVQIPMVFVSIGYRGISPEDSERLLLKPAEQHLQSLEGIKEIKSVASEGVAHIQISFQAGVDINKAITKVRDRMGLVKKELPSDVDEPLIEEMNVSLFPVLVVQLSGNVPARFLYKVSDELQDKLESIDKVLKAQVIGGKEEVLEVHLDPFKMENYGLSIDYIRRLFQANNLMVPSGQMVLGDAEFPIKTPGLLTTEEDFIHFPIKTNGNAILYLKDIADIRKTYKRSLTLSRSQGVPTVSLEITKRIGQNIIQTIDECRKVVAEHLGPLKDKVSFTFSQDRSQYIRDMLNELQNNIILAVLLVMVVVILSLGWRSSLLVGISIPASFLTGIFFLGLFNVTLNIVVLFSLILSVGMLVDGAIIVIEYADRKMAEGLDRMAAYRAAALKMSSPVMSSLATHIVVFLPLLFWPGIVGEFMKFLPLTLIFTLGMSLFVALLLIPVLGSYWGKLNIKDTDKIKELASVETGSLGKITGTAGAYVRILKAFLQAPLKSLMGIVCLVGLIFFVYVKWGRGVEFFPDIEPEQASYVVRLKGNLSAEMKQELVTQVEAKILHAPEFKSVYTTSGLLNIQDPEIIGQIRVELIDWKKREKATAILDRYLKTMENFPGLKIELEKDKSGPSHGKDIQIEITSHNSDLIDPEIRRVRNFMSGLEGVTDIEDTLPLPGIEWALKVDRAEALKSGTSLMEISQIVRMMGDGVLVTNYQPSDSKKALDVVLRFSPPYRDLKNLQSLRLSNDQGSLPLDAFVKILPVQKVHTLERVNGKSVKKIMANVASGFLANNKINEIQSYLKDNPPPSSVSINFKGDQDDQNESRSFLLNAFGVALFIILVILVAQFNSFFSAFLVLSAVILATAGGLLGLLIMNQPFSIVMGGIGMIALAGIIVSNNIIFIDTFDQLKKNGEHLMDIMLRTGALRLRPIILTQLTAILGLLPILLRLDIDFMNMAVHQGAPSGAWWVQLATIISFGLGFGSLITLIATPCALMVRERNRYKK